MSRYHLTNQARADLHDIFVYGFEQFGERQADAYAAGLDHVFGLLAENPQMGRKVKSIAPSVRRHEYGSHIILPTLNSAASDDAPLRSRSCMRSSRT